MESSQATAFQLARHHLLDRGAVDELPVVLADMNGAQAQLLSAARLALWARLRDVSPNRLDEELWERKSLVRSWCMRRTLYLLPSKVAAVYGRGSARRAEKEIRWMLGHGATRRALERSLAELLDLLSTPRSRTEIAELLAERLRVPVESREGGTGWGNRAKTPWVRVGGVSVPVAYALHLAGARGVICLGPARGAGTTYVRGDAWTRAWRDLPTEQAERELLLRYLRSFGPATPHDFATWTGMTLQEAREVWGRVATKLTRVNLDGREAWALRADLKGLLSASVPELSVRLLPPFDSFLLGHRDHVNVVARHHHPRVYRAQGWVSSVLLVNGTVAGVWDHAVRGDRLTVRVEPFVRLSRTVRRLVAEEGRSLGRFLGAPRVEIVVERG